MNKKVKKKWTMALRSGQYDQIRGALCAETTSGRNGFCCMGVLCNIHAEESKALHWEEGDDWGRKQKFVKKNGKAQFVKAQTLSYLDAEDDLPHSVRRWSGLTNDQETTLINMNDEAGSSFDAIADFIEKNL